MGQLKNYIITLISNVADDVETSDAIEYALVQGWVSPSYNLGDDVTLITGQLPTILEQFRRVARANMDSNPALQELVGAISDYK